MRDASTLRSWWQTLFDREGHECRRQPRRAFAGSIMVITDKGSVARGIARDLSPKGMGALVTADLTVGERVQIRYRHPRSADENHELARGAQVRGRYGNRYGFEFEQAMEC